MENYLELNDNYRIGADGFQFILYKRRVISKTYKGKKSTDERERWKSEGFYSSVANAVRAVAKCSVMDNLGDLQLCLKKIDALKAYLTEKLEIT